MPEVPRISPYFKAMERYLAPVSGDQSVTLRRSRPRINAVKVLIAEIVQHKLPMPVEEHRFHPVRKWRFDLAFPEHKVAIEVHGAVFSGGRHTRGMGFENDREKNNEAQIMGWTVLEYSTGQVLDGVPILDLKRVLQ